MCVRALHSIARVTAGSAVWMVAVRRLAGEHAAGNEDQHETENAHTTHFDTKSSLQSRTTAFG